MEAAVDEQLSLRELWRQFEFSTDVPAATGKHRFARAYCPANPRSGRGCVADQPGRSHCGRSSPPRAGPGGPGPGQDAILAKDLVRQALREAEKNGRNGCARADLQRILDLTADWQGNSARAKAVFACGGRNIWREFELPPQLAKTQLFVNRRFHLNELAVVLGRQPRLRVAILDRHRARLFDLHLDEVREQEALFHTLSRRRGDGFLGYDAGHAERSVNDEVLHHFKNVAEVLKQGLEKGAFDQVIIGCPDIHWHDFEAHLHPYVRQRLLGRFAADVGKVSVEQVREQGERMLKESLTQHRHELVREALGQARSNGRGVTGLRRVCGRSKWAKCRPS